MVNTLIVDDSPMARSIIRDFLEEEGSFRIIGEAADGAEGVEKIFSLDPDLVTLDLEMPKMNGFEVIETVLKKSSVPIVVITSHDAAKNAYEAVLKGALEFYSKDLFTSSITPEKRKAIYDTLKRISSLKANRSGSSIENSFLNEQKQIKKRDIKAVVIASSTGGPKALSGFFSLMPEDFPVPVAIVQHNTSGFDKSFAQWLDAYTPLEVKIAEEGEMLVSGKVYIAHTDKHLMLKNMRVFYDDGPPENNQKPAADVLFRSAAEDLNDAVISVVLTGMGSDGAAGTRVIHERGGITLAQDENSSLIYGMPKAALETGCVDKVLPLEMIPQELIRLVSGQ